MFTHKLHIYEKTELYYQCRNVVLQAEMAYFTFWTFLKAYLIYKDVKRITH